MCVMYVYIMLYVLYDQLYNHALDPQSLCITESLYPLTNFCYKNADGNGFLII